MQINMVHSIVNLTIRTPAKIIVYIHVFCGIHRILACDNTLYLKLNKLHPTRYTQTTLPPQTLLLHATPSLLEHTQPPTHPLHTQIHTHTHPTPPHPDTPTPQHT